ncbi:proteasome accessory factor B [Candidatus Nanopelagicus limnes]|uniref:Proteasome accessory factor B n=1 Tax=Candidatus Nanopelagicus limnae TaxID=1884634 RepID=A0A249JXY1_9ACTN|nr:WYL domain-containing protein [Candidatus Nanopelagicus limnes]ASY09372.1 proteasome accessory factor B [Candidatus Nanopelagicus limnes]
MSDQKTERLINLTLALLSSKRYLTKSEIFNNVAGYSGSPETMERMFERDKDELRNLGIRIEVRALDPLFEDDQGYLIDSDTFQINPNDFSQEEIFLLTMAANLWHGSALQKDSKAALLKIQSLDGLVATNTVASPVIEDNEDSKKLLLIFDAVQRFITLEFEYKGTIRQVEPYGIYTRRGFWYLAAQENDIVKSFKVVRIGQQIRATSKAQAFDKPSEFKLSAFLEDINSPTTSKAEVRIRKNQALALRKRHKVEEVDSEWDKLFIDYIFEEDLIESLLWYGSNLVVISPTSIRNQIVNRAKGLMNV